MFRDSSLLVQVQVALIGIVLVFGLFYMWRNMSRLEEKLDRLQEQVAAARGGAPGACKFSPNWSDDMPPVPSEEEAAAAEEFMKRVFGSAPMMFSGGAGPAEGNEEAAADFEEAEAAEEEDLAPRGPTIVEEEVVPEGTSYAEKRDVDVEGSELDLDQGNPLSKTKLKKMTLDALKDMCHERGLPAEGSKQVLVDRLLGLARA